MLTCSGGGGGRGRGKRLLNRGMNNGNYIGRRDETAAPEGAPSRGASAAGCCCRCCRCCCCCCCCHRCAAAPPASCFLVLAAPPINLPPACLAAPPAPCHSAGGAGGRPCARGGAGLPPAHRRPRPPGLAHEPQRGGCRRSSARHRRLQAACCPGPPACSARPGRATPPTCLLSGCRDPAAPRRLQSQRVDKESGQAVSVVNCYFMCQVGRQAGWCGCGLAAVRGACAAVQGCILVPPTSRSPAPLPPAPCAPARVPRHSSPLPRPPARRRTAPCSRRRSTTRRTSTCRSRCAVGVLRPGGGAPSMRCGQGRCGGAARRCQARPAVAAPAPPHHIHHIRHTHRASTTPPGRPRDGGGQLAAPQV